MNAIPIKLQFMRNIVVYEPAGDAVRFFGVSPHGRMLFVISKQALLDYARIPEANAKQMLAIFQRHRDLIEIAAQRKYDKRAHRDPVEIVIEREDLLLPVLIS